jgi:hypothetical protein
MRISRALLLPIALVALAGQVACDGPRRIPPALLTLLEPDTVRGEEVAPGVRYRYLWAPEGPWAVHLLDVELDRCELVLDVGVPQSAEDDGRGFGRVTEMVERRGDGVVAAVNGDFFTAEGLPIGSEVGPLGVRGGRSASLLIYEGDRLDIDRTRARPGARAIETSAGVDEIEPDEPVRVLGGLPRLLEGGVRVGDLEVGARPTFAAARHPRTAIGYEGTDGGRLWIVVVDGRREGYSVGMTLPELTEIFEALGAREALNLDGGGSTAMVVDGRIVNRPSDPTGERAVANALLLVKDPSACGRR